MSECIEWDGAVNAYGYGKRRALYKGGTTLVHRQEWEAIHGAIAPGLEVMHLCDSRACCRRRVAAYMRRKRSEAAA